MSIRNRSKSEFDSKKTSIELPQERDFKIVQINLQKQEQRSHLLVRQKKSKYMKLYKSCVPGSEIHQETGLKVRKQIKDLFNLSSEYNIVYCYRAEY